MHKLFALVIVMAAGTYAFAGDLSFQSIDNSSGGTELIGFVTQDLIYDTLGADWTSAEIIVELTSGTLYHNDFGNPVASPNPAFFPTFPALEFDTYLSNGVVGESISTIAAAVDIDSNAEDQFDSNGIAKTWYTSETDDIGQLALARMTLSNDAIGTWAFRADGVITEGTITDGVMVVPEPATMSLIGLGAVALLRRRSRKA